MCESFIVAQRNSYREREGKQYGWLLFGQLFNSQRLFLLSQQVNIPTRH